MGVLGFPKDDPARQYPVFGSFCIAGPSRGKSGSRRGKRIQTLSRSLLFVILCAETFKFQAIWFIQYMYVIRSHKFTGIRAMYVIQSYKFIGFGAISTVLGLSDRIGLKTLRRGAQARHSPLQWGGGRRPPDPPAFPGGHFLHEAITAGLARIKVGL